MLEGRNVFGFPNPQFSRVAVRYTSFVLPSSCSRVAIPWFILGQMVWEIPWDMEGREGFKFSQLKWERKSFLVDKLRAAGLLLRVIILQLLIGLSSRFHSPLRSQPVAHVTGNNPARLRHKGSRVPHSRSRGSPDIPDLDAEAIFFLRTDFLCSDCNPFVICTMLPFVIALLDSHP